MMHMIVNVFTILHAVAGLRSCKGIKEEELYAENVAHNLLCSYIKYSKGIMTIVIISMDTELCYVGRLNIIAQSQDSLNGSTSTSVSDGIREAGVLALLHDTMFHYLRTFAIRPV